NGTTYTIGVRAINDVGHGATSNMPSVTPLATVPVTVGDLTATAGDGSVALSFTPPNNGGSSITKYEYSTDGGTSWLQLTTLMPQGTRLGESVSFDSTGVALTNGQSYTFVVRADNSVGNGANSNAATVTPGNVAP
ncbi:MAG: fibronectin type protein, partial [Mycobacterium sp.]|nr:fibronectin type protein [Mycobacterium sp.]